MNAMELVRAVEANGGRLRVDGEYLVIAPRAASSPVRAELIENKHEIIALILERDAAPWRKPFKQWLKFACSPRSRAFGGLNCLFVSFIQWAGNQNRETCGRDVFEWLLAENDFLVADVEGTPLVAGLMLKEDALAHKGFLGDGQ